MDKRYGLWVMVAFTCVAGDAGFGLLEGPDGLKPLPQSSGLLSESRRRLHPAGACVRELK